MSKQLEHPYNSRANLSHNLVAREAYNFFVEGNVQEVRFQRTEGTDLMYDAYTVKWSDQRPSTNGFDLDSVALSLGPMMSRLTALTSVINKPTIRVIRTNQDRPSCSIFIED